MVLAEASSTGRTILVMDLGQRSRESRSSSLQGRSGPPQQQHGIFLAEIAASLRPIPGLPTCEGAALLLLELQYVLCPLVSHPGTAFNLYPSPLAWRSNDGTLVSFPIILAQLRWCICMLANQLGASNVVHSYASPLAWRSKDGSSCSDLVLSGLYLQG